MSSTGKNTKVIGIDLGTGNSCVAVIENGKPVVVANAEGSRTTPSVIFIKDDERTVGALAKRKMTVNPLNTVSFIKRFMGVDYNDPDVQKMLKRISYKVVNQSGKPRIEIPMSDGSKKLFSPEEISSMTLTKMKQTAEDYYGEEVTKAVITVPAWFNDTQRQATKLAGELAGLEVLRIINEPTSAILASNIKLGNNEEKTVAVVDLGCGTLDISVCDLSVIDGQMMAEVKSSYGSVFLGGENFDQAIVEWIISEFKKDNAGFDLRNDPMAYSRVLEAAEKAKCELSTSASTDISIPYITMIDNVPAHLNLQLTRAKYEQLTADLVDQVVDCARIAFEKAGKTTSEIDEILLVGGMTRSLNVQEGLTKAFGLPLDKSSNPDESVALGAAIQANILGGGQNEKDILLLDVTPVSLGIMTEGNIMTKLIEANTTIPTQKKEIFTTAVDNQPGVQIVVLQGERQFAKDNKQIGIFNLDGIAPARRGVPQIEVTFDINADGILTVTAMDKATNKEQHITITSSNTLSEDEIKRIKEDAEKYKEEDARKKAEVDKLNAAESYAYQIRDVVDNEDLKDKITEDEKSSLKAKIDEVLAAVKENDVTKAESLKGELEKAFMPIATKLYASANPNGGGAGAQGSSFGGADMPDGFKDIFNKAAQSGGAQPQAQPQADAGNTANDVPFDEVQ